jgi:hypothetical protein
MKPPEPIAGKGAVEIIADEVGIPAGTYGKTDTEIAADWQRILEGQQVIYGPLHSLSLEEITRLYPVGDQRTIDDSAHRLIRDHYRELADRHARKNRRL